jgi:hypothetical protein
MLVKERRRQELKGHTGSWKGCIDSYSLYSKSDSEVLVVNHLLDERRRLKGQVVIVSSAELPGVCPDR